MRISDWSSDVCSSDLHPRRLARDQRLIMEVADHQGLDQLRLGDRRLDADDRLVGEDRGSLRHGVDVAGEPPGGEALDGLRRDRKSVVAGKSVSVRVDLGGRRIIKKKKNKWISK